MIKTWAWRFTLESKLSVNINVTNTQQWMKEESNTENVNDMNIIDKMLSQYETSEEQQGSNSSSPECGIPSTQSSALYQLLWTLKAAPRLNLSAAHHQTRPHIYIDIIYYNVTNTQHAQWMKEESNTENINDINKRDKTLSQDETSEEQL